MIARVDMPVWLSGPVPGPKGGVLGVRVAVELSPCSLNWH
jgi:hypothetical protein